MLSRFLGLLEGHPILGSSGVDSCAGSWDWRVFLGIWLMNWSPDPMACLYHSLYQMWAYDLGWLCYGLYNWDEEHASSLLSLFIALSSSEIMVSSFPGLIFKPYHSGQSESANPPQDTGQKQKRSTKRVESKYEHHLGLRQNTIKLAVFYDVLFLR